MQQILEMLQGPYPDSSLVDLLGYEALDFITDLIENKQHLVNEYKEALKRASAASTQPRQQRAQHPTSQFVVQFSSDKKKKSAPRTMNESNLDVLSSLGFDEDYVTESHALGLRLQPTSRPNHEAQRPTSSALDDFSGLKTTLPEGTVRVSGDNCEEYRIPASPTIPPNDADLISISSLPLWTRMVFKHEKHLNRIQSKVFDCAFNTNENFLMCAPTGAGKTNVAMLAICRLLSEHLTVSNPPKFDLDFKCVYMAPMKALVGEVVEKFSSRLGPLGISVRELTGDMQLTRKELAATQVIVTVPEKWDVITRNLGQQTGASGEDSLLANLKLILIDEIHLLNEERGAVIEAVVARTARYMEITCRPVRLVALSATLPNYMDVAKFLNVKESYAFQFDAKYRPVALEQSLIGCGGLNQFSRQDKINSVCFEKVKEVVAQGHQVMVFVHSRIETAKTAEMLIDKAANDQLSALFSPSDSQSSFNSQFAKSRSKQLHNLFLQGFSIHHAGMLRADRNLVEKAFTAGAVKVLVCTATLAWGVNLPARCVVIKGTSVWDSSSGGFTDLGILDVLQIFGRAGRPQFDTVGQAVLITTGDKLSHYLRLMTNQIPVESRFDLHLGNALNAEIALGNISTLDEAADWLRYTYLFVRFFRSPQKWGLTKADFDADSTILNKRRELIMAVASRLHDAKLIRIDGGSTPEAATFNATELGRVAAKFYVDWETAESFSKRLRSTARDEEAAPLSKIDQTPHSGAMTDAELLELFGSAKEFSQLKTREEEQQELELLWMDKRICPVRARGGPANIHGKVAILLQCYISGHTSFEASSLVSDLNYITQSASRLFRAMFKVAITRTTGVSALAEKILEWCKCVDNEIWDPPFHHMLRHFCGKSPAERNALKEWTVAKLESKNFDFWRLKEDGVSQNELASLLGVPAAAQQVIYHVARVPYLEISPHVQPIANSIARIHLTIRPNFIWSDKWSGAVENFHVWVVDPDADDLLHAEMFNVTKKDLAEFGQAIDISFVVPLNHPRPPQYVIQFVSDRWVGLVFDVPFSADGLFTDEDDSAEHTKLLDLAPLPKKALKDDTFIALYPGFTHFNAVQTQVFHYLFHTDGNALVGAPTGSGKTVISELAILRLLKTRPGKKVVYIAPLKALSRERIADWSKRFKKVSELTGDFTPDSAALAASDIIVTTPEKWDGITRNWQQRNYVKNVGLVVIDEIHLLGTDRGAILEVIVSRMRNMARSLEDEIRFVGLSTALANAKDIAEWLGVNKAGLYNFSPAVRPVPMTVHIQGFPEMHYCPRMATMNKPCLVAIKQHSPEKPVLIFVSSRRQTRLTALDLIAHVAQDESFRGAVECGCPPWLKMSQEELATITDRVQDADLRHTLAFGVGTHQAGLCESDRGIVEKLFCEGKIQVLIATSTLAWGVNFPAHLVIVKGTEFFDGNLKHYVDLPITDVLQMIGRAGRPQFDDSAVAVVMAHEPKRAFYRKFLYSAFPVESSLHQVIADHLNAEISLGSVGTVSDAIEWVSCTFFFRRLAKNPCFYGVHPGGDKKNAILKHLNGLLETALSDLRKSGCISVLDPTIEAGEYVPMRFLPTDAGKTAAMYYLSHETVREFRKQLAHDLSIAELLKLLSDSKEYSQVPVRHNEDKLNAELQECVPFKVRGHQMDSPHAKVFLLLQAHLFGAKLPITDYRTDTKNVLDQSVRLLQAMVDLAVTCRTGRTDNLGCVDSLHLLERIILLQQAVYQGANPWADPSLPILGNQVDKLKVSLADLVEMEDLEKFLVSCGCKSVLDRIKGLPRLKLDCDRLDTAVKVRVSLENQPSEFAFSLKFSKKKAVSYWLIVRQGQQIHGVYRFMLSKKGSVRNLEIPVRQKLPGDPKIVISLMPDSYAGLDQVVELS